MADQDPNATPAVQDNTATGTGADTNPKPDATPTTGPEGQTTPAPDKPADAPAATDLIGDAGKDANPGTGTEPKPEEKPADKPAGAPEAYVDFTLAEGVTIDQPAMDKFKALAKEANLPQEVAQRFVDLQNEMVLAKAAEDIANLDRQSEEWAKETKGIYKDELPKVLANVAKAKAVYDPDGKFTAFLKEIRMSNHPLFVAFLAAVGKDLQEDTGPASKGTAAATKSAAAVLYPGMNP
jgi:hypothetical protein